MEIRIASYNDYEEIAKLNAESWRANYRNVMDPDYLEHDVEDDRKVIWQTRLINPPINQHVLLIEDQGQLCGYICVFGNHDFEKGSIIESLHIAPSYQGQGLGRLLLREVAQWIEQFFPDSGVYIEVMDKNRQEIDFYDHLGGQHNSERVWHAPSGNDIDEWIITWDTPKAILSAVSA